MQNVRPLIVTLSGIALMATAVLFTASIAVAFAGVLSVLTIARALSPQAKPAPVRAHASKRTQRIWNDGHGTIIDM